MFTRGTRRSRSHNPQSLEPGAHECRRRPLRLPRPDDVAALIDAAGEEYSALPVFFRIAAVTGARRGELCALRWRHVDLDDATIHIAVTPMGVVEGPTKADAERRVSIDPGTVGRLRSMCGSAGSDGFVFFHDGGTSPWRPDYATRAFARLTAELDLHGLRLHDMRHFAATTMLLSGIDVRTAAGGSATHDRRPPSTSTRTTPSPPIATKHRCSPIRSTIRPGSLRGQEGVP